MQAIQIETLFAIVGIKTAGMEDEVYNSWENKFNDFLYRYKSKESIQNIYNTATKVIQTIAPFIILVMGAYLYFQKRLTLGEVIAFHTLSNTFFSLCSSIFYTYNNYVLASSYLERVCDITDTEIEKNPSSPVQHEISGDVKLDNISFCYTKHSKEVIKNVSLHIKKGQKVAIVGPSGSGKSTLSKILVGLYSPTSGRILYDNIDMEMFSKQDLRKQMGIVPQDITLFNKSIYENIKMNKHNVNMEMVKVASEAAQISAEIESMPMAYHTVISELGMNLSGGQRQRIALARALINQPKIIILDEATSSLDAINEEKVSNYLRNIGCTRIVIAHRLSTIIDSDVIYVMDNGNLVEYGTHEELIYLQGKYHQLYKSQVGSLNKKAMVI